MYILINTDGYGIGYEKFPDLDLAKAKMQEAYDAATPENFDEEWKDMSYISDKDAILYANGEAVYVWSIIEV